MKSTPHLITRDHDPRRADKCNLHTHVIANNNKSPIEKCYYVVGQCVSVVLSPKLSVSSHERSTRDPVVV